ncbi:MAG: SelB C-terminal domain-containing protein [Terrimicrobiaceae bacterium]
MIGGPQGGLILGKARWVEQIRRDPFARIVRVDKISPAALEATLRLFLDEQRALAGVPILAMLRKTMQEIERVAARIVSKPDGGLSCELRVENAIGFMGGGSLPGQELPTRLVEIRPLRMSTGELARALRQGSPSIFTRIRQDAVLDGHHKTEPQSPGLPKPRLAELGRVPSACFETVAAILLADGRITFSRTSRRFSRAGWQPGLPEAIAPVCERVEALFRGRLFHPPAASEAARELGVDDRTCGQAIKVLKDLERLVEIPGGGVFHSNAISEATARVTEHIKKHGRLESVDFKYQIDTTRKYALPLLDHLDALGITRRVGNTRFLKTPDPTAHPDR